MFQAIKFWQRLPGALGFVSPPLKGRLEAPPQAVDGLVLVPTRGDECAVLDLATGDVRQDQVRWLLLDNDGDTMDTAATPVLAPYRYYALTPGEETGTWVPFPTP